MRGEPGPPPSGAPWRRRRRARPRQPPRAGRVQWPPTRRRSNRTDVCSCLDDSLPRVQNRPVFPCLPAPSLLAGLALTALALAGCPADPPAPEPETACGNSIVDPGEACDDGDANADASDACRLDCTLPVCGDAITDTGAGETCDDGAELLGGDGCSPSCLEEALPGESEPNDTPGTAVAMPPGLQVTGALPQGDSDCFSVLVPEGGWVSAEVEGEAPGSCPNDLVLRLFGPTGGQLATGTPGLAGCSPIDPIVEEGARFAEPGNHVICAEGFFDEPVASYTLTVEVGDDSCALDFPFTSTDDPDGDSLPNVCDVDDDGDGFDDEDDNCPETPNGPEVPPLYVDAEGFLTTWLVAGPFPDLPAGGGGGSCEVSDQDPLGDEATAIPELATPAGDLEWFAYFDSNARFNFLHVMGGPTPREVYAAAWVNSPVAQTTTLAMGIDDGGRAYWNGVEVFEVGSCQGTNIDQFQAPVDMVEGWNRLLIRVRDQGGGWALYARFLDETSTPITGLEVSLTGPESFSPGQQDTDGDGLGDWCDPTPTGE
ncbi:MAG: hypothetical protein KDA24_26115 [Deltaproteobacteria bacterium]|nr:hypothetical protein [Deltaproteobacteria bacterium]